MGIVIRQDGDGSAGLVGQDGAPGDFVYVSIPYDAASVDKVGFVASRSMIVKSITARVEVAGTDGSAVTAVVKKAASGTAIASGTALHTGTHNLKGTAATNQVLALSATATDLQIPAGTAIGVDFTGTLTAATGVITIGLCPA